MNSRWHIITGEYPPQDGGVADYTQSVARGLAAAGDEVVVWAPNVGDAQAAEQLLSVRRLAGRFGPQALAQLDRALDRSPGRVLVQYTPHAFGWKSMNVAFCAWLWSRRRDLDVMFHEVAFPLEAGQPLKHSLLAVVHRGMASLLLRAAQRVFLSIPGWEPILNKLATRHPRPLWVPIPSNLPTTCTQGDVEAVRARLGLRNLSPLVGHFGTYGSAITRLLEPALVEMLRENTAVTVVLLGRGGPAWLKSLIRTCPNLSDRIVAPANLGARTIAGYLTCCDVLLQPYPDGISSRRSSAMAGLALGRPMVTTQGHLTESLWRESRAVHIAEPSELATATRALLADTPCREALGKRGADLYRARFAIEHTIDALRQGYVPHSRVLQA